MNHVYNTSVWSIHIDMQPQDKSYSSIMLGVRLTQGIHFGGWVAIIYNAILRVFFGNGCFPRWINLKVGAICSCAFLHIGKSFIYNVAI